MKMPEITPIHRRRPTRRRRSLGGLLLVTVVWVAACDGAEEPGDGAPDAIRAGDAISDAMNHAIDAMPDAIRDGVSDAMPDAIDDTPRTPEAWARGLAGLWSGPASRTPLGDFPVMNMDLRAADGRTLFSRFDLDPEDGLRFAFAMETVEGTPTLVFRNGGYFLGILRDTRAVLVEGDGGAGEMRFCHRERGCDYLDARWRRPSAERLELTVDVRGTRHVEWRAQRAETRSLPDDFALTAGPHDAPFPDMPSLGVRVHWADPLPAATPVWLLVSATPCGIRAQCTPARLMSGEAPAGATEITLRIDQIHPGPAVVNAVLDRDGNFRALRFPSRGDGLASLDRAVDIAQMGSTEIDTRVSLTVP